MAKSSSTRRVSPALNILRVTVWLLVIIMLVLTGLYAWPALQPQLAALNLPIGWPGERPANPTTLAGMAPGTATPSPTFSLESIPVTLVNTAQPPEQLSSLPGLGPIPSQGLIILSIDEGSHARLFAFPSQGGTPQRLTDGPWDDSMPALSPDGKRLAFASNRDGFWELYVLELADGEITRLTYTPQYDGSPSWSPDSQWLAYETYQEDVETPNLELYIRPVDGSQEAIRLTDDPAADHSPSWSSQGRQIAFVSNRTGDDEIWLANLDAVQERFINLSLDRNAFEAHPTWAPDGLRLAWTSNGTDGLQRLYTWDTSQPLQRPAQINLGDWSAWSPAGDALLASLETPNQTYLTGYSLRGDKLILPLLELQGRLNGMSWANTSLPDPLPVTLDQAAQLTPTPIWSPALTPAPDLPTGRQRIVPLQDFATPAPMLQDLVDESFQALRQRIIHEAGWDLLSNLEGAFVPLTAPLGPGMTEDWLYTGRAFRFNPAPLNADWMLLAREDYGPQTYWRIYLRPRFQDGSQGMPLKDLPWDIRARYSGDAKAYEQGGRIIESMPPGYWLDLTRLASAYDWSRLPALNSWRLAYSMTRFNELALTDGLDWFAAMLQIYPREALNTTTPVPSPTNTPTITLTPTRTIQPTRTRWMTRTPTMTGTPTSTRTPRPTKTPWPTRTPVPSNTPWWTSSPTLSPTPGPTETPGVVATP